MTPEANTAAAFLAVARARIDRLDARLLLQHVAGLSHADLISRPQSPLDAAQWQLLETLLARREAGEPLAYLVGSAEFRGRRFAVSPAVLIPRPETEELVACALGKLPASASPSCLDLGTGSGIIAVSLQLERRNAQMVAVDLSGDALALARENALTLGAMVDFRQGSWYGPLSPEERFHLIVSNPPYVAADDPHLALNGLPYEPQGALTDGEDGLSCIRAIVAGAMERLVPGGWLLFEHGYDQGKVSRNLLLAAGFEGTFTQRDLAGNDRISGGQKP